MIQNSKVTTVQVQTCTKITTVSVRYNERLDLALSKTGYTFVILRNEEFCSSKQ